MTPRLLVERLIRYFASGPPRYRGTRGLGQRWENLAARRLEAEGYAILERNFRGRSGEIDFIAEENGVLCFIEVKGRRSARFGAPAEAVTAEKRRRISRVAEEYLRRSRRASVPCRFDVVAIAEGDGELSVTILRNAFEVVPRA